MSEFTTWFLPIIGESWFLQGLIINTTFTIVSIPFSNNVIKKIFKNRKKEKIKNAQNELIILCAQKMITEKYIDKNYFENQLFILANKYNLEVKDLYNNEKDFSKNLIHTIIEIDLLDNDTKENIAYKIRNNRIFMNPEYGDIIDKNGNILSGENDIPLSEDDIKLSQREKQNISKFTLVITISIFVSLLLIISIIQILYKAYGIKIIIFIDSIIIMIIMVPLLMNGIFHYEELSKQGKKSFYLFMIILLLNIINFICMVNILLIH